jgi:Domain of unknown function (DUF4252)
MKRVYGFVALMMVAVPLSAQIQIPLDSLAAKASDTTGLALDQSMLKLAGNFLAGDKAQDPGFQKVLNGLKSLVVKKYTFAQEGAYQDSELAPLRTQLSSGGWGQMITVHRNGGSREIYVKSEGGVTVVLAQPKQVIIVSIEGAIDLAKLAELAGHFGIPAGLTDDAKPKAADQK